MDTLEEQRRAEIYARARQREWDNAERNKKAQKEAEKAVKALSAVTLVLTWQLLKFSPILIPIGLIWSWVRPAIHGLLLEYPATQINHFVARWMTSWGIPDFPIVRTLLTGMVAGVKFLINVAFVPILKMEPAFNLEHLHRVGFWLAVAVMIVVGIATMTTVLIMATSLISLALAPIVWSISTPVQTIRGRKHRGFWNWVLTIMSAWMFRNRLHGWAVKLDPRFFADD
jgi:hypothetical protein